MRCKHIMFQQYKNINKFTIHQFPHKNNINKKVGIHTRRYIIQKVVP